MTLTKTTGSKVTEAQLAKLCRGLFEHRPARGLGGMRAIAVSCTQHYKIMAK
ncbi:hypothetical protein D3C78_1726660 [compost metagenome]